MAVVVTAAPGFDLSYIWKNQADQATLEHSAGGYYLNAAQAGEPPGRWWGRGAAALGFAEGQLVERRPYEQVYSQIDPHVAAERLLELEREAAQATRQAPAYTDLTVSLSKSLSIFHASIRENERRARLAGDEAGGRHWADLERRYQEVLHAANRAGLEYVQRWAGVTRTGYHGAQVDLDGGKVAGDTYRRRRRGLNAAVEYAVEGKNLDENPLHHVKTKRVASDDRVDPRVVINHAQARELLTAVSYVGSWHRGRGRRLVGFFAVLHYAGVRPAEAVALREKDCDLPHEGWGKLTLTQTLPVTTKKWTNDGERHEKRGLKQRDPDAVRVVPIPPWLVQILRAHIDEFGVAGDGRLFRNERDGILGASTYSRVWEEARQIAFTTYVRCAPSRIRTCAHGSGGRCSIP
jgi:integrase